jgi:hypothetical protein
MAKRLLGFSPFWKPLINNGVGLPSKDKLQVAIYTVIFFLIGFYVISILPAFISLITTWLDGIVPLDKALRESQYANGIIAKTLETVHGLLAWLRINWIPMLAVTGAVYAFFPKLKEGLTFLTINSLSLENYFMYGEQRAALSGKFENLLNDILEREGPDEQLELHTFSFGGILALDSLFPYENPASPLVARHIHRLITIAVLYDYVRVYYPHYFKDRKNANLALREWYNVYSDIDILSSNFRNDNKEMPGDPNIVPGKIVPHNLKYNTINPESLSWVDRITLIGFRSHNMFWDGRHPFAHSCYQMLWQNIKEQDAPEEEMNPVAIAA